MIMNVPGFERGDVPGVASSSSDVGNPLSGGYGRAHALACRQPGAAIPDRPRESSCQARHGSPLLHAMSIWVMSRGDGSVIQASFW
jgi:hypothetical protein